MIGSILSYQQIDPVKLQYKIDLKNSFLTRKQETDLKKWDDYFESDPCNNEIFELKGI